jgi:hypothetical protein
MGFIIEETKFWKRCSPTLQRALLLRKQSRFKEACEVLYQACTQDKDREAMYFFAKAYHEGGWRYIHCDPDRAVYWYMQAGKAGHAAAIVFLNDMEPFGWEYKHVAYNPTYDSYARSMEIICNKGLVLDRDNLFESIYDILSGKDFNFHMIDFRILQTFNNFTDLLYSVSDFFTDFINTLVQWREQNVFNFSDYMHPEKRQSLVYICGYLNVLKAKQESFYAFLEVEQHAHPYMRRTMYKSGIVSGCVSEEYAHEYVAQGVMEPTMKYLLAEYFPHIMPLRVFKMRCDRRVRRAVLAWLLIGKRILNKDVTRLIGMFVWRSRKYPSFWLKTK